MSLSLGLIYKDNKPCNHRSLIKILINPFLRLIFRYQIGSMVGENESISYRLIPYQGGPKMQFNRILDEDEVLKPIRRIY